VCSTRVLEPERADRCLLEATFWALVDFSDSFKQKFKFAELAFHALGCIRDRAKDQSDSGAILTVGSRRHLVAR
jgi:hypothetical protein